jgi:hypothetical protein
MRRPASFALAALLFVAARAAAQPAYKVEVKPDLKPLATLKVEDNLVVRSELADDPGFRLQFVFKKDGKTVSEVEARSRTSAEPPAEPGVYTVVLELFYPAYKGGNAPKGEFKPVSNVLTLRVEAGPPVKVTPVAGP